MSSTRTRISRAAAVASLVIPLMASVSPAQESGTLLSQNLTVQKSGTDPVIQIRIASPKSAGLNTRITLEIGPDGNSTVPAPDPALPASAVFRLAKGAATKDFTLPSSGNVEGDNNITFSGKNVTIDRFVENTADPRGLYRITIGHITAVTADETWTLTLIGIPASRRVIASIDRGAFTSVTPVGVCGGGSPPSVCPLGQACREPCQFIPIKIPIYYQVIKWPFPLPDPGPICPMCGQAWGEKFDQARFDRSMIVFVPTPEQRTALARDKTKAGLFTVSGGELIGGVMEASNGKFMQLVQHPKGSSPLISITAPGAAPREPAVTPQRNGSSRSALFGFGGLVIGALAGVAYGRGTRPDNQRPM